MARPSARGTLAASILGSAIVFVDSSVVNVALPAIREDLHASLAAQQWVVEAYLLLLGSLVLVGGSLGDLLGRRRVFAFGVATFGLTSLSCAAAPSVGVLIGARALQGVAGALLVPGSLALISEAFPDAGARGRAIGTWTAFTSAAIAFGPPLGGLLVDVGSWRLVFAINVPLVLGCLWLTQRHVAPTPGQASRRVDVAGAILCALGLGGPVLALVEQPSRGWASALVWLPLAGGLVTLGVFVAHERRAADPMLPLSLFADRVFAVANVTTLAVYAGLGAATFYVALFLQQVAGYTALGGGAALLPVTVLLVTLSRRWGALAARTGPRALMTAGPLLAGAGLALYTRLDASGDYATQVLPATLVFGLGMSMTVAPLTSTVLGAVHDRHAGVASGINNAVARVAALLSIAVVGAVVAARLADPAGGFTAAGTVEATAAFHAGLWVAAALAAAGGLVSFVGLAGTQAGGRLTAASRRR